MAITNDPVAPLAEAAEHQLPLLAGKERAVAATKTYTTQLLALAMLSAALDGPESAWEEIAALPEGWARPSPQPAASETPRRSLAESDRMVVVGRGFNLSTAFEIALKIKETSYVMADPYSSADFQHGPIAMLDETLPLLVVAPGEKAVAGMSELLRRAHSACAPLVALTDQPDLKTVADAVLPVPRDMPEWLSPVTSVVAGQLWAHALDPGARPRPRRSARTRQGDLDEMSVH